MPPAGFEPAFPEGERQQTHALDRSATGIGSDVPLTEQNLWKRRSVQQHNGSYWFLN